MLQLYKDQFLSLSDITGLPFKRKGNRMIASCYLDGSKHHQSDKTWAVLKEKGVYIAEQGGENVSLPEWLERFGDPSNMKAVKAGVEIEVQNPRIYVNRLHWESTIPMQYKGNLFKFLAGKFGVDKVSEVFWKYNVGEYGNEQTIFWYIGKDGKVCHDQRINYRTNGKRKSGCRKFMVEDGYSGRCVFGAHLLKGWKGEVCVVESEKTALVMALSDNRTDRLWTATGGSAKMYAIQPDWKLYPDFDEAGMAWVKRGGIEWWNKLSQVEEGWDCADYVLNKMK